MNANATATTSAAPAATPAATIQAIRDRVAKKRRTVIVPIIEWGVEITLRQMSAAKYFDVCSSLPKSNTGDVELTGGANIAEFYVRVIVACAVNADGSPLFGDGDEDLLRSSPQALAALGQAAMKLNGLAGVEADGTGEGSTKN